MPAPVLRKNKNPNDYISHLVQGYSNIAQKAFLKVFSAKRVNPHHLIITVN